VRLVLDTNVLISAFISRGHCHDLLERAVRVHQLFTSDFILEEFQSKLLSKFRINAELVSAAVDLQRSRMSVVPIKRLEGPVSRDADDDWVLATAVAAGADCLVTGDADLLDLEEYEGIPILNPSAFWAFEARFETGT
jgi:putative PIN family toxin of toxin-antitoxin system